jgi:hypothetical protein
VRYPISQIEECILLLGGLFVPVDHFICARVGHEICRDDHDRWNKRSCRSLVRSSQHAQSSSRRLLYTQSRNYLRCAMVPWSIIVRSAKFLPNPPACASLAAAQKCTFLSTSSRSWIRSVQIACARNKPSHTPDLLILLLALQMQMTFCSHIQAG